MTDEELKQLMLQREAQAGPLAQATAGMPAQDVSQSWGDWAGQGAANFANTSPLGHVANATGIPGMVESLQDVRQGAAEGDIGKAAMGAGGALLGAIPGGAALKGLGNMIPTKKVWAGARNMPLGKMDLMGQARNMSGKGRAVPGAGQITGRPITPAVVSKTDNPAFTGLNAASKRSRLARQNVGRDEILGGFEAAADKGRFIDELTPSKVSNSIAVKLKQQGIPVPRTIDKMAKETVDSMKMYKKLRPGQLDDTEQMMRWLEDPLAKALLGK